MCVHLDGASGFPVLWGTRAWERCSQHESDDFLLTFHLEAWCSSLGKVRRFPHQPAAVGAFRGRKGEPELRDRCSQDSPFPPSHACQFHTVDSGGPSWVPCRPQGRSSGQLEPQRWSGCRGSGFTLDALLSSGYTVLGADLEGPFIPIFQRFLNNAFRFSP